MQETAVKKPKKLPGWAGWLIGYVATLAAAAGLVYYWRVVFSPLPGEAALPMTLAALGVATLLYLALYGVSRLKGDKLCLRGAALVFVLGLVFCFASAPLQAPDEDKHYLRAYAISEGHFDYDGAQQYPGDVDLLIEYFPNAMNHKMVNNQLGMPTAAVARYQQAVADGETAATKAAAPLMFSLLPFLPQALLMAIARLFGFSALGLMYAGRIANLIIYTLICYATFKNCDKYRGVFFAVALLPISLFMAASCSYDGIMLPCCFLMLSFFCKRELHTRDLVVFGLALLLASYIKINNIVLVAVLLLIPKSRWKTRINPRWATLVMAVAGVAVWYLLGQVLDGQVLLHGYPANLPRGSGGEADPTGQIAFIFSNIPAFIARMLLNVYENAGYLFNLGTFGWTDLTISLVSGLSVLGLATASALGIQQREDTRTGAAVGLGLGALLYSAAVLVGMYVLDSDLYSIRITGPQPRYFLPAFLMLFMLGSILLGRAVRPRLRPQSTLSRTESITLWVVAGIALLAGILLFQNYFIGQWLPKADGGWKMVNLFGWQVYGGG
ncbi:MAG: DUF2142 domain-containing protein [Ruminococcaceae bacterium]|nr:DUF2142 domain-containing protein [Oscillospiraceae bacterium]